MRRKKRQKEETNQAAELLKDLLIVELAKARVPQKKIRTIVGVEMGRVNQIARYFKNKKREPAGTDKA